MKKAKLIGIVTFCVLAVIIFLQNTETTQTRVLFMTVEMSRALLLILTFVLGLLTGLLAATHFLRGKSRKA